ncbi:MAG: hypothetical protein V8Q30_07655 [Acutalibacteraceae bacterium]
MMSTFRASGKRHLLITGQKRIGKSTLCDLLLEQKPFAGLQSYACWGSRPTPDRIEMRDLVTGEVFPIGTPGQGRMNPFRRHWTAMLPQSCARSRTAAM